MEILEMIDFEVPTDFAYAALVRAYKSLESDSAKEKIIVSQCLAFLKEGLQLSCDFSLCAELGTAVLNLVVNHSITDRRVKEVCSTIYSRKQKNKKIGERSGEEVAAK